MLKFVVLVIFLTVIGLCTKCKGSPTSSNRIRRQTNSGCSNAKFGETIPLSEQQTVTFNGAEANRGAFPWHVGIYNQRNNEATKRYICGGTIISENIVISAAHCFTSHTGETKPVSNYYIGAGKVFSNWDAVEDEHFAQKRNVSKIEVSKSYLGYASNLAGDIAVVVVSEPFVLTNFVRPACVDWSLEYVDEQLKDGILGQVVGWGASSSNYHEPSLFLKQNKFPFIELDECYRTVPPNFKQFVTIDKYCAGYTNGTSVCNGDGGNGMTFTKQQKSYIQGVVSVGPSKEGICDIHQLGVYTKLSIHMGWIKKIVEANKINPAAHN